MKKLTNNGITEIRTFLSEQLGEALELLESASDKSPDAQEYREAFEQTLEEFELESEEFELESSDGLLYSESLGRDAEIDFIVEKRKKIEHLRKLLGDLENEKFESILNYIQTGLRVFSMCGIGSGVSNEYRAKLDARIARYNKLNTLLTEEKNGRKS